MLLITKQKQRLDIQTPFLLFIVFFGLNALLMCEIKYPKSHTSHPK